MKLQKDLTTEYKNDILLEVNKRIKNIIYSFLACIIFLMGSVVFVSFFSLPETLVAILFLPCGFFFVYQVFLLKNVKCPYCKKSLLTSLYFGKIPTKFNALIVKKCNHCGAKLM